MNLQQPRTGGNFAKIPFKISNKDGGKREDAFVSGPQVRNNFFTEGEKRVEDAANYEGNNENRESVDT